MPRESNRLSAAKVKALTKPGRYADGAGLYLQVSAFGTKAWLLRYMRDGAARHMGLGSVADVSLAGAREKAATARRQLADGLDPIEAREAARKAAKAAAAKLVTFRGAAERYIETNRAGWKNGKHEKQWTSSLEAYVYPLIGDISVADVDNGLIVKILEPIWTIKNETASRVRGRIETVLDWATARGYRTGDNPARWRGHLENVLPARKKVAKVKHHPALSFEQIPAFMQTLRAESGIAARALEFTILTAARTAETIGATWPEIDHAKKIWTVPAARIKSEREHRVPLSDRALEILAALPREKRNAHLFIGAKAERGLSNMAMLELLRRMGREELTVHGFRSTFRDWAGESTNFPREVAEAALAHIVKDRTEAAYRRRDALEKRRQLMAAWSSYCASSPRDETADNVTNIGFSKKS